MMAKLEPTTLPICRELRRALRLPKDYRYSPPSNPTLYKSWVIYNKYGTVMGTAHYVNGNWVFR